MKNLDKLFEEVANENKSKARKVESINDALVRLLYKTGKKYTREQLKIIIMQERFLAMFSEDQINKMNDEEIKEELRKIKITVKNGLDQSFARGQNNASFHYNEKYASMKLVEAPNRMCHIEDAKKA